jgi:hypothetical protein
MKEIHYAYPTSKLASKCGGCWCVLYGKTQRGFSRAQDAVNFADTLPGEYGRYSFQFVRDCFSPHESNSTLCEASLEAVLA